MPIQIDPRELQAISSLEFIAKQAVEGFVTGLHRSPFHGFSVEFAEHRLYNPGESMRHVDWKLYARTDRLYTKRFEEETNLRCQLVIDVSRSMYHPLEAHKKGEMTKLRFAAEAGAALIELFKRQRDAVGLSLFDSELHTHIRARSTSSHHRLLYAELERHLESADPAKASTAAVKALHTIAEATPRRSLVVVMSDLLDSSGDIAALAAALQHLRHAGHEVVVFHILDEATEARLDYDDRPTTFVDLETGEKVRANPVELRDVYVEQMAALRHDLSVQCGAAGIDWVEVDIAGGVVPVLTAYMLRRRQLH